MAEVSSSPFKNNHVNRVADMEPTISTPLQQEPKRKRQHNNNETTTTNSRTPRRKKPRKKMYRPKVFGEGRKKIKVTATSKPKKPKTPKTPKTPRPATPNQPRTPKPVRNRKLVVPSNSGRQENRCEKSTNLLEHDDIVTCRDLVLVEKGLESENVGSCRDLVLVDCGLESGKALAEVKEVEEDHHSKSIVIHTAVELTKRLGGWFCVMSNLPLECKRKRSSWTRPRKVTERKPCGLKSGRGKGSNLLPFFFCKRKRTPMVRKCNLASLSAHCKQLQLLRNAHKHDSICENTTIMNGNDIVPTVGWMLKRPNQFRNRKRSQDSSKFNCNIRDEFDCQSPSASNSNDNDASVGTATTDGISDEFDCHSPSVSKSNDKDASVGTATTNGISDEFPASKSNDKNASVATAITDDNSKFSDIRSEGTLWKIGDAIHTEKLSHNSKPTMRWLDIRHFLTKSRLLNGRSEKTPPERSLSLPRIITGTDEEITKSLQDVRSGRGGSPIRQQNFTLPARPSESANEMRPALNVILWNRNEGTKNNPEHIRLTAPANNIGILGEETDSYCKKVLIRYPADCHYNKAQFRSIPTCAGTNNSIGLLQENSQKEGTDLSQEKKIIPYVRKQGKKTSTREHNPSYLHGMEGAIVPHTTKKKELGRVNLDPRDLTMWKLLNPDQSNFGQEKADVYDEKWWANERETFHGQIYAFIARMSVILGDRRFSPWKGSVVDSVVGVFLTQNVSDHLSSSAYMSLAATFPFRATSNHTENYQQSTQRNNGYFLCESKWNNDSMLESKNTTEDPYEAEELMSASDAISYKDLLGSLIKLSLDETLLSPACLEDGCGTCLCVDLNRTNNTVLHSNKSTFAQEPYSISQTSTSLCGSNQENNILESNEVDCRNQNPSETMHMLNYLRSECISKSTSGLENKAEESNRCEGTVEVDLQYTPNEKSQSFIDSVRKFQNQEIQLTGDVNAKCCLCSDIQTRNGGIKKTTEFYNYYQEKMEPGSQLSPIDDSSKKLDVENVQSQESVINGAQKHLEDRDCNDLNDEQKTEISKGKAKKSKMKPEIDWNNLREKWDSMRRAYSSSEPRSIDHMDSVDWEAVRSAEPIKIADAIKERGQHNIIAGRIKDFLNRTARIHGRVDLEWLRQAPPNDVKEYLLDIDGIGLKSVECIRLLSLEQVAFPVDVNVGRIAVRIGWVPLEPLPDEVQMHRLETFPMMDSIQKYLWPRLNSLDQRTLYELHYQLITFGKVFCTKRAPNCIACPLRVECRHYASANSARLALPGLPEKSMVSTIVPDNRFEGTAQGMNPVSVLHIESNPCSGSRYQSNNSEPIIEVPQSPEPAYDESQLTDIEDLCEYDSDDVAVIRLSSGRFTTTSQNGMDDDITRALVPFHAKVASIPIRKLKHIERLRTEHQTYELPDTHPLLHELEKREPNDPCPYLLCISSPGETIDSSEPPNTRCVYEEMGKLCTEGSCSSCNIVREQNCGTVRGTILIPCRTAMRGKFPLNGTYFQVNEVFADDESSKNPIHVPREWIWDLPRRITYFGTSTATIFRGLPIEDIQYCFQKGFICVRGFNRKTLTPKRLVERLHRPPQASVKARANKNTDQPQKPHASNSNSPAKL